MFLTQQVGAENDRDLVKLLLGDGELPFPKAYLSRYLGEIFLRVPIERNIEDFEIKDVNYNEYL